MNGLCEEVDVYGAMEYMNVVGFNSNLVALNTMVDGWCKADWIDCALKIFDSMDTRDSFSHSSLIHNLCKDGRFRCASKLLLSCVRSGMSILPSTKHAVFDSLSRSGCQREAKRLKSEIKLALSAFV
jgi:pentatricopeptide repeat protein